MAYLTYVQARVVGGGKIRCQATGDAYPTGYASGNFPCYEEASAEIERDAFVPSMRGTAVNYLPLVVGEGVVCTPGGRSVMSVEELLAGLNAPSPAYGPEDVAGVAERVNRALNLTQQVDEDDAEPDEDDLVERITSRLEDVIRNIVREELAGRNTSW